MSYRITITYLVIANEQALHTHQAAPALVWKRELTVTSDTSQTDPDWCYVCGGCRLNAGKGKRHRDGETL